MWSAQPPSKTFWAIEHRIKALPCLKMWTEKIIIMGRNFLLLFLFCKGESRSCSPQIQLNWWLLLSQFSTYFAKFKVKLQSGVAVLLGAPVSKPGTEPSPHQPLEIVLTGRFPSLSKWTLMNITHFNRCIHKKLPIMDVMHEFFSLGNRLLLLAISWSGFDESLSGTAPIEIGLPEWGLKEQLNKDLYNCSIMIKWFPWARQLRKTCFHLATFVLPKWNSHIHCRQSWIHCCCCCCDCGRAQTGQEQARRGRPCANTVYMAVQVSQGSSPASLCAGDVSPFETGSLLCLSFAPFVLLLKRCFG